MSQAAEAAGYLLPLVLLLAPLLLGRYPGERLLVAEAAPAARRRSPRSLAPRPGAVRDLRPCAIALLSCGVSGRAPPSSVAAT